MTADAIEVPMGALCLWFGLAHAEPLVDSVTLDVGNHSLALPFGQLGRFDPVYPSAGVAAEHRWVDRAVFTLAETVRVGAFRHGLFGTSVTVGTDLLARFTAGSGPTGELGLGLGVIDSWRAREVLVREDGTYRPGGDPGRPGATLGFTMAVGMDLGGVSRVPLTPLLVYRWFVQTPFLPALGVGPQGTFGLGLRWTPP